MRMLLVLLVPSVAFAQQVGDSIVVIKETDLKSGDRTVSTAVRGKHLKVEAIKGDWFWVEQRGERGWINGRDVIPAEQAVDYFTEAIRQNPTWGNYACRGIAWATRGEHDIAIRDFNEAMRLDPKNPFLYNNRGGAWENQGEYDRAIADFNEAIRLNSKYVFAYYNRGTIWARRKGDYSKAIADYNEAIRLDPKYVSAYNNRGNVWNLKGEYDRAIADFTEAIRLDPKQASAYDNLALIHATCPDGRHRDGRKAVEYATKACELSGFKNANAIDTLAAAYAEAGEFAEAIEWIQKAIELRPGDEALENKLALFREGKPYRREK